MIETREQIKDRMLKTASVSWGLDGAQTEGSFDPLVGMLLGACATELEKISHDIEETRSRTLERLVQLLFPDVMSLALPAHAVAYAYPSEKKVTLESDTQFYFQKKMPAPAEGLPPAWKNIFFSPSAGFTIQQATVKYMLCANSLYAFPEPGKKELVKVWEDETPENKKNNSVWLGIENCDNLKGDVLFYFEVRNEAGASLFYDYLPHCQWYFGENNLTAEKGFGKGISAGITPEPANIIKGKTNALGRILKGINIFYARRFITVAYTGKQKSSKGEEKLLAAAGMGSSENNLGWIRIDFPENIHINKIKDDLLVTLNCFPVVNRRLVITQQKLMDFINVIPLSSEEWFLDIGEITGMDGKPVDGYDADGNALTSLHFGGVERFNEKNAGAAVEGLIQQLRDESASFSFAGKDFMNEELRQLQQSLNRLEQQVANNNLLKGETPYLIMPGRDNTGAGNIYVKFWTTNGDEANNIKAGTGISLYKSTDVAGSSAQLMTNTAGGRAHLSKQDKVLAYKAALLSKEKLVTEEDIASFCRLRLALKNMLVKVTRGFIALSGNQQGFSKSIDVVLYTTDDQNKKLMDTGGLEFWKEDLTSAIKEHSNFFMPVRVFIKQQSEYRA